MKKYCFLFVFLVAALSLRAQIVGDVAVTRKVLAERGGELHMVLEISVSRKAVTRSQSWTILPELSTPDRKSVKLFPHILIIWTIPREHRIFGCIVILRVICVFH